MSELDDVVARDLGRIERMNARKGLSRLPELLDGDERVHMLGVAELPYPRGKRLRLGREIVVLAVTDRRLLLVGSARRESLGYEEITNAQSHDGITGGRIGMATADGRELDLHAVQPARRATDLIALVNDIRSGALPDADAG